MTMPSIGDEVYVVYLGEEAVEVTKYPTRAAYRAAEWSVPGKNGVVASAVIRSIWDRRNKQEISPEAHAAECGLGPDCPRTERERVVAGGSEPMTQMEFDFSDEEPTIPNLKECKCQ